MVALSIKDKAKRAGGLLWSFLDGPSEIAGYKTKKVSTLAKDEVQRLQQKSGSTRDFWAKELAERKASMKSSRRDDSFEAAVVRYGLDEKALRHIEDTLIKKASVEFYLIYLSLFGLLTSVAFGGLLGVLSAGSLSLLIVLFRSRTLFRLKQTRDRKLYAYREFLSAGGLREVLRRV